MEADQDNYRDENEEIISETPEEESEVRSDAPVAASEEPELAAEPIEQPAEFLAMKNAKNVPGM